MNLISFAARNMIRAGQRTWVVIGAMAFAGFIMIYYASMLEGFVRVTERNAIGMDMGQFQIHEPGYRDDPDLYNRIKDPEILFEKINQLGFHAAPRLFGFGLAASGDASAGIRLRGVDLVREPRVTNLQNNLFEGTWLTADDPAGVVIGRKLAKTLGVSIGSEVVVVSQASDGSMANDLFHVRGILKSVGEGIDRAGFLMTADTFRTLMVVPDGVHEIALTHPDGFHDLERLTNQLAALAPDLEVRNWRQLNPVVARIIDMSRTSLLIMLVIMYTAVGILTLNGMLMNVFERIRELGIMKALGFSPFGIFLLIQIESLIQVTAASLLALGAGLPLSIFSQTHPLDLTRLAGSSSNVGGVAFDPLWYTDVTFFSVAAPVIFLYLVTGLSILYPAAKAAMIRPLQAIYHR